MPVKARRSCVSADISKHVIWINSTDYLSTIRALKIHKILVDEFKYVDSGFLEFGRRGFGVSISVTGYSTIKELWADYNEAKELSKSIATTEAHETEAKELIIQLHGEGAEL
ncbi:hypothetical protein [Pseudoalteromonas luteoviolacea]|uniref:hypothetical protein n=1 Tax=Pseudoalteromonas luteoviolacea TaxID=43657 RepID=UPI001B383F3F|nr:hypothetical protein [Pseudoalteromonas luteoviolacea]MBQ4839807.1 hypothetical protein [Pseudoalteromonas luteoviolacea]